jgi:hypothetical protein
MKNHLFALASNGKTRAIELIEAGVKTAELCGFTINQSHGAKYPATSATFKAMQFQLSEKAV